jgi:hypothetical protein
MTQDSNFQPNPESSKSQTERDQFNLNLENINQSQDQVASLREVFRLLGSKGLETITDEVMSFLGQNDGSVNSVELNRSRIEVTVFSFLEAAALPEASMTKTVIENLSIDKGATEAVLKFITSKYREELRDAKNIINAPIVEVHFVPATVGGLKIDGMHSPDKNEVRDSKISVKVTKRLEKNPIQDKGVLVVFHPQGIREVCNGLRHAQRDTNSKVFDLIESDVEKAHKKVRAKDIDVYKSALAIENLRESLKTLCLDEGIEINLRQFFGEMEEQITGCYAVFCIEFSSEISQVARYHFLEDTINKLIHIDPALDPDESIIIEYEFIRMVPTIEWPKIVAKSYNNVEEMLD